MLFNNGVPEATTSRKRKMKEIAETTALPPPPTDLFHQLSQQNLFSTALSLDLNIQQKSPALSKPFKSFMSLLTEGDEENDFFLNITRQTDQILETQSEQLKRTLSEAWRRHYSALLCAAEERAVKKMREKESELAKLARRNAELELREAYFKTEAQVWEFKFKKMEQTAASLQSALHEANAREESTAEGGGTDEESSHVVPDRVGSTTLACKACGKRGATVMMWPCRHVSVCTRCNAVTEACPVCLSPKSNSLEVLLPY